jgi:hypothetical protein
VTPATTAGKGVELVATPTGRAEILMSDMLDIQEVSGFGQEPVF